MIRSTASKAARVTPATTQGVRSREAARVPPAGAPQLEQNRALRAIGLPQREQADTSPEAPQLEQNFPDTGAPQELQSGAGAVVIRGAENGESGSGGGARAAEDGNDLVQITSRSRRIAGEATPATRESALVAQTN